MIPSEGWLPDPSGRHQYRHYSGEGPTAWVSDGGQVYEDPLESAPESARAIEDSDRPLGWYRNASNPEEVRFWDGSQWTDGPAEEPEFARQSAGGTASPASAALPSEQSIDGDGWHADPLGRFRFRWISSGVPTQLVSDNEGQVAFDQPNATVEELPVGVEPALNGSSDGTSPAPAPAEWYPDPSDRTRLRYWDGSGWTNLVHAEPPSR